MSEACLGRDVMGLTTGPGEPLAAPLHPFSDVSLDVDTGRTGKVKRNHDDKVTVSWLPQMERSTGKPGGGGS